jgi:Ca-activated chloride channel family protein
LFLAGLVILMISAARPQMAVSLPHRVGTVILAFDVSGSMAADDVQPTRIEAAKTAAREFVDRPPQGVNVGVVAFSDSGFSVQVPTDDQDAVLGAINRLTPQLGTSLANGIYASLNVIEVGEGKEPLSYSNLTPVPTVTPTAVPEGYHAAAVIVLLTDGENNEDPSPLAAAQAAADRGVRIYTVGLGSPSGTTLQINGFSVHTQLDEDLLKQIAQSTGGAYYGAEDQADLKAVYQDLASRLVVKAEETEVTSLFAAAGALLLLIAGIVSLAWYGRVP